MFQQCSYARAARAALAVPIPVNVNLGYISEESTGGVFMHARIFRTAGAIDLIPRGSLDGVTYFDLPTALWQLGLTPTLGADVDRYIKLDGACPKYLQLRLVPAGFIGTVAVNLRSAGTLSP